MSMHIFNESLRVRNVDYDRRSVVDKQRSENLPDYVRRVRVQKGFSLTDVERNSKGRIDASYVNRIENGLITNVSPEKLSALAEGLEELEETLFAVARGKSISEPDVIELQLLSCFRSLPPERQTDAFEYLQMLCSRYGQQSGDDSKFGERPVYKAVAGIPKALKKNGRKKPGKK